VLDLRDSAHRPVPPHLPLEDRIQAYCKQQARLLEQIAPAAKASSLKEPFSEALQQYRRLHVDRAREELTTLFAAEIDGDEEVLHALIAVSMWPAWATWREAMGLPMASARAALARAVRALLV
jgi:hypothetical protein